MTDLISLRAAGARLDISTSFRDATRISDWDLGNPEQRAGTTDGTEGGVRSGPSDWETARQMRFELDCLRGNVPGDGSGNATNRVWGRTPRSAAHNPALTATSPLVSWGPERGLNPLLAANANDWGAYASNLTWAASRVAVTLPDGAAGWAYRGAWTATTATAEPPYMFEASTKNAHVGAAAVRLRFYARLTSRTAGIASQPIEVFTQPDFRGPAGAYYGAASASATKTRLPDDGSWVAIDNVHADTPDHRATQIFARLHSRIVGGATNCPAGEGWTYEVVGHPEGSITFWDGQTQDVATAPWSIDTNDVTAVSAPVTDPRITWGANQITNDGSFENGTASGSAEATANVTPTLTVVDYPTPDGTKAGQVASTWSNTSAGQATVAPFANIVPLTAGVGQYVRARGRFKTTSNTLGRNVQARLDVFLRDANNAIITNLSVFGAPVATQTAWETLEWGASADSLIATYPTVRRVSIKVSLVAATGGVAGSTTHMIDGIRLQVGTLAPAFDVGAEVRASVAGNVVLDLMRGTAIVATSPALQVAANALPAPIAATLAAMGGAEAGLSLRARLLAAPAGATIEARAPIFGVGLGGIYFDQYTPGASRARAYNYVRNPRVKLGPNGWSANNSAGWDGAGGQPSRSLIPGSATEYGMRCVGTNPTATLRQLGIVASNSIDEWMRVTPGETVFCHLTTHTVVAPATHGVRLQPVFVDAAGQTVQATSYGSYALTPGTQTWAVAVPVPEGAFALRYAAGVFSGSIGSIDVYFTRMGLSRSSVYVDGDSDGGSWLGTAGYSESYAPVGPVSRPASGEAWANAWLADIGSLVGGVARDTGAVLVRSGDGLSDDVTLRLHSAKSNSPQKGEHHRGHGTTTLEFAAEPIGRGTTRALPGDMQAADGLPVWASRDVIPGDYPALASVRATFPNTRRQALAQLLDGPSQVILANQLTDRLVGTSFVARAGSVSSGATVLLSPSYTVLIGRQEAPLGSGVVARDGVHDIDLRFRVPQGNVADPTLGAQFFLLVNGREVAREYVENTETDTASYGYGWQLLRLGRHALRAGQTITLGIVGYGGVYEVDYIALHRVALAASIAAGEPTVGNVVAGAAQPNSGGTALNGTAGEFGGTWSASEWTRDLTGPGYTNTGYGTQFAAIGSKTFPLAVEATVKFGNYCSINLESTTDNSSLTLYRHDLPSYLSFYSKNGAGSTYERDPIVWPMPTGSYHDVRIVVDDAGRYIVEIGPENGAMTRACEGSFGGITRAGTWRVVFRSGSPYADFTVKQVYVRDVLAGTNVLEWGANSPQLVKGDLPALPQGTAPRIAFRAGGDHLDAVAGHAPSSVAVEITPRYLQVP